MEYKWISEKEGEEIAGVYKVIIEEPISDVDERYYTHSFTLLGCNIQFKPELKRIGRKREYPRFGTKPGEYTTDYYYFKPVGVSKITLSNYRIIEL